MELDVPTLKNRWIRLQRYDRDAWKLADDTRKPLLSLDTWRVERDPDEKAAWASYGERLRRVEAVRASILARYIRLASAADPGFLTQTVTWSPTEKLETYDAEKMVTSGKVPDSMKLTRDQWKLVESWAPLTNVSADSESGQGFIYCAPDDVSEVVGRLKILGCKPMEFQSVSLSPPRAWRISGCWPTDKPGMRPIKVRPLDTDVAASAS